MKKQINNVKNWAGDNWKSLVGYSTAVVASGLLTFGLTKSHYNTKLENSQRNAIHFVQKSEKSEKDLKRSYKIIDSLEKRTIDLTSALWKIQDVVANKNKQLSYWKNTVNKTVNKYNSIRNECDKAKNENKALDAALKEATCEDCKNLFNGQSDLNAYQRSVCNFLEAGRIRKAARIAEFDATDYETAIKIYETNDMHGAAARVAKRQAKEKGTLEKRKLYNLLH